MANLFQYFGPAFLVAVGFMDPGNWVTLIEGGSRFGFELVWVVFFSTLLAMLLQTVSARLGVITGKHFAQVCREEFPWAVCALLWGLCELSIITLDLTMVLGTAIGLNVVLRMPILPSLFLMAVDSLLFMILQPFLEAKRAVFIPVMVVGIILLCFLLDSVFTSTLSVSMVLGLLPKLRHETLYATISIVGASVMPHNFYLYSALVKDQSHNNQSLNTSSRYYFFGTLFAFCAVLVVNLAVLGVAVAGFHNAGLVVLTLQDAQALIEQILNNSVCPPVIGLALLYAGQLSTLNGSSAGQVVSEAFFDYKIYAWQHRILIRGIALVPVAICAWKYGNEGAYQMLVFSQVLLALHLPFTIVPLIKITSSERIMGSYKNSFVLETLAWLFLVILSAVNVTLVFDLVFGESEDDASFGGFEYLGGLEWLTEIGGENLQSVVFGAISVGTTLSLCFLVWLIFTPLQLDTQLPTRPSWIEDYARKEEESEWAKEVLGTGPDIGETFVDSLPSQIGVESKDGGESVAEELPLIAIPNESTEVLFETTKEDADSSASVDTQDHPKLLHLDSFEGVSVQNQISSATSPLADGSVMATSPSESIPGSPSTTIAVTVDEAPIVKAPTLEDAEANALKSAEAEADAEADAELVGKDDDEMDAWDSLGQDDVQAGAVVPNVNGSTPTLQVEGSESGKIDINVGGEGESGSGSLSRLSGLGRAARRQFALILDEFWANLFDLHGQPRAQGLPGSRGSQLNGNHHGISSSHEGSDGQKPQSKQHRSWKKPNNMSEQAQNIDTHMLRMRTHATASTSSQLSKMHSQEYRSSPSYMSERRYSSMHTPIYHEDYDYQPATIHGYRTPSFLGRTGNAASLDTKPVHVGVPLVRSRSSPGDSHQFDTDSHSHQFDTDTTAEVHHNTFDYSSQPLLSSQWVSNVVGGRSLIDTKGFDRLLTQTEKHLGESETSSYDSCQWDPLVYRPSDSSLGRWNPLVYRATGELDMKNNALGVSHNLSHQANFSHSPIGRGVQGDYVERAPLVFDELSPSQSHRDAFSIQTSTSRPETQSLWSRQPFEQLFGATDADGLPSHVPRQMRNSSHLVQSSLPGSSLSDGVEIELEVLQKFQVTVGRLLQLDGADWLFRSDNGVDEDVIAAIAATQKISLKADKNELYRSYGNHEHYLSENYSRSHVHKATSDSQWLQSGIPNCGKGCVWEGLLLISFGVWCVHRILELSLMESRPELWGKYTYVLNRLQGILEPAFSKPRLVPVLCKCVNDPVLLDIGKCRIPLNRQGSLRDHGNGDFGSSSILSYPHPWPWGRNTSCPKGKSLNAATFVDMIKEVESAVGSRKGRTGTAAGDVAFPKGKENLASVLKRYKRRLLSKPPGSVGLGNGGRRVQ